MTQHRLDYAGIKESKIKLDNSIKRISGEQEKPSKHSWANKVELEFPENVKKYVELAQSLKIKAQHADVQLLRLVTKKKRGGG